jgi:hypothetical protein
LEVITAIGLGSSGDREGHAMAHTVSELLVGNGAVEVDRRFRMKEACRREDSKRAILFQVIFYRVRFRLFFAPSVRTILP